MKFWKLADIGGFFRNSLTAILKGEFLLRLNVDKYFVHICFTFFLFAMTIWISLGIENTLAKVEAQKAVIKELEIEHSQKIYEYATLGRRGNVESELEKAGSKLAKPQEPAIRLK